ncbi:hypothetical protein IE53DRAFT_383256 [Violaceomyces palustris]|uniref:Uncharacterized protein n=1 Tax=Violaceomyces palustris TaxID=1673888 RepID=A0ACD0P7Z8_9BASI|nr:hypothetical protein IE53DRAFT_383256 [Violaceomyces palustris]
MLSSSSTASAQRATTSANSAVQALLRNALPQVKRYGFTREAILAGNGPSSSSSQVSLPDQGLRGGLSEFTLSKLFPGKDSDPTSAPNSLFRYWDQESLRVSLERFKRLSSGEDASVQETREEVYMSAVQILETRLELSGEVRDHLLQAFTNLSTVNLPTPPTQSLPTSLQRALNVLPWPVMFRFLPKALPNPEPMVSRAYDLADITLSNLSHLEKSHPIPNSSPSPSSLSASEDHMKIYRDYYDDRARLTLAYLLSELHLSSPSEPSSRDPEDSKKLFRRIAVHGRRTSLAADLERVLKSSQGWITWGSRGWLGIFRSLGL